MGLFDPKVFDPKVFQTGTTPPPPPPPPPATIRIASTGSQGYTPEAGRLIPAILRSGMTHFIHSGDTDFAATPLELVCPMWGDLAYLCAGGLPAYVLPDGKPNVARYRTEFEAMMAPIFTLKTQGFPILINWGNHEFDGKFPPGQVQTYHRQLWGETRSYWSFDLGPAHIVFIDTGQSLEADSPQRNWLLTDLAGAMLPWLILWCHSNPWSQFKPAVDGDPLIDPRRNWGPIFDAYNVDLIFCGHPLIYEATEQIRFKEGVNDRCEIVAQGPAYQKGAGRIYVSNGAGGMRVAGTPYSGRAVFPEMLSAAPESEMFGRPIPDPRAEWIRTAVGIDANFTTLDIEQDKLTVRCIDGNDAVRDEFTISR